MHEPCHNVIRKAYLEAFSVSVSESIYIWDPIFILNMKLINKLVISLIILMGLFVILFEIDFDGDISVRLRVDIKTKQLRNKFEDICPKSPIAKADALGRLGNQISTYVNHISLQWEYGK